MLQSLGRFIYNYDAFHDVNWIKSEEAKGLALLFAIIAIIISLSHIISHLRLFTMPLIQIYVIRILFTCPIYALTSSLAMFLGRNAIILEAIRDLYEAVVIYSFFNLILEYGGGETDCVYAVENDAPLVFPFPFCYSKPRPKDAR